MLSRLLFAASIAVTAPLHAQRETYENFNAWLNWVGDIEIDSKWAIDFDASLRRSGPIDEQGQLLLRPSLRRNLGPNVRVSLGYAFVDTRPYGKLPVAFRFPEHRIFQQLQLSHGAGRVQFAHRYRLEQRWNGRVAAVNGDTAVQNWIRTGRVRYLARALVPLQGGTLEPQEWFVNFTNEVMLNFGANINQNTFDQNRAQLNVGRRVSRDLRLELGYLEHFVLRPSGRQIERNHTIVGTVTTSFRLPRSTR